MTYGAVMALARWTPYLEPEMLGLADVAGPGSVCLDVGAAAGLYSFALSRLVGPSGHVHSIEPLESAHPLWRRILGIQGLTNVSQYTMALDAEPGKGVMSVPFRKHAAVTGRSFLTGRSSGLGPNVEFVRHEEVPVAVDTMDGLVSRMGLDRLDFIKIDVEGGELHVLHGGEGTIKEFRPALLVEIEARHTARYQYAPEDIVNWLTERDYAMYTWHDGWRETGQVSLEQRNYLFRARRPAS
jgi:FkbM family methyltransferase